MVLALTILAIMLASLALGVQLADLRVARGGRVQPRTRSAARNDNDPATGSDAITVMRPKIVPASITRRCAHR